MNKEKTSVVLLGSFLLAVCLFALLGQDRGSMMNVISFAGATPVNISRSSADSGNPHVGVDANQAASVVWFEYESNRNVYFATNRSGAWTAPSYVLRITSPSDEMGFPFFAVSKSGVGHLTYQDENPGIAYDMFHTSYNNGWGPITNISDNSGASVYGGCAVNPLDNFVYVVWQEKTGHENELGVYDICLRYRSPSGTWGATQVLPVGGGYEPKIAIDANGTAHVVWGTWHSTLLWYSRNRTPQNSSGWTAPVLIKGDTGEDFSFPMIDCDNAGNAYVIWMDGTAGNDEIFIRRMNGDGTMSPEVNVSNSAASSQEGAIAVHRETGKVYVAWTENGDIFLNAYAGSWTGPVNVSSTSEPSMMPNIAADSLGNVYLVYTERTGGNYEILYLTTSQGPIPTTTTTSATTSTTTTSTSTSTTSTTTSIPVHPKPPVNPALGTRLDATESTKINVLTWQANPENSGLALKLYRIYRKRANLTDRDFVFVAAVPTTAFAYADEGLPLNQRFTYGLTTIPVDPYGLESDGSDFVTEPAAFPPLDVACKSEVNNSLFRTEKINVITWRRNRLDDAVTVLQYNIYRKRIGQDDSQFLRTASVNGGTFEYQDRKLPFADKYVYAVTAVETGGVESGRSNSAAETS